MGHAIVPKTTRLITATLHNYASHFFMLVGLWASHSPRKLVGEVKTNMLGIIIGTAATIGAIAYVSRRRRCASRRWYGGHWYGGHCGHHGRHDWGRASAGGGWTDFGSRGPGRWAAMLADRLDASREQEKVMGDALGELLRELRSLGDEAAGTRTDLGAAFGSERLDEQRLGELFARHDDLLASARKALVGALTKIHDVLDPKQREQLGRWIGRRGFGPYRM